MTVEYGRQPDVAPRSLGEALKRGFLGRCPHCGEGAIFSRYTTVNDRCPACGEEFLHHRADDAPPYLTIFVVGHIVVPLALWLETTYQPEMWIHWALWLPLTLILSLALLPRFKGAMIGLQWALRMHGFGGETDDLPVRSGR